MKTNKPTYTTLSLETVLEKTKLSVSQLVKKIETSDFPSEMLVAEDGSYWWLEVEVQQWLAQNQRQTMLELINSRAQAQREKYPQLAASTTAAEYPYIDIDKSTADFLVIQTEYRALGINLKDLLQLIQTHTSIDKTRFVNRVLFGQLKTPTAQHA